MIEFLLIPIIAGLFVADRGTMNDYKTHLSEPGLWYKITRSWWKGAFESETAAFTIARMIDSDQSCEIWKVIDRDCYFPKIISKSLKTSVTLGKYHSAIIQITNKDGGVIEPEVSLYDEYLLREAFKRFISRRKELEHIRTQRESLRVIDERVTSNYVDTIEMVEKKILKQEPEQADLLRTLLSPPNMKKEYEKRVDKITKEEKRIE